MDDELKILLEGGFKTQVELLLHINHILSNQANVLNLYVAQEESLKNNIGWLILRAISTLEDSELILKITQLEKALPRLDILKQLILERLAKLKGKDTKE